MSAFLPWDRVQTSRWSDCVAWVERPNRLTQAIQSLESYDRLSGAEVRNSRIQIRKYADCWFMRRVMVKDVDVGSQGCAWGVLIGEDAYVGIDRFSPQRNLCISACPAHCGIFRFLWNRSFCFHFCFFLLPYFLQGGLCLLMCMFLFFINVQRSSSFFYI